MSGGAGRILALELNDLGVRVAGEPALDGLEPSPGWAVFEPDGIRVGAEAAERIRLNPRLAHRQIWAELDLEPLPRPFPRGLSTADLAYSHLRSVFDEVDRRLGRRATEVGGRLLVAPGSFSVGQLGLALGIAESLERPFTGVVDSAVAAASTLGGECVLLDLELGRAVASELAVARRGGSSRLVRRRVRSQQGAGWNALLDLWARSVGRAFVTTTRFDPLHAAASEQRLYLRLPEWLAVLAGRESMEASMRAGDREHRIVLTRGQLAAAAEPVYAGIVELARSLAGPGGEVVAPVVLSHRLRDAPGLIERLEAAGFAAPAVLAPGAALDGALRHAERLHQPADPEPLWVTELPAAEPARGEAEAPATGGPAG